MSRRAVWIAIAIAALCVVGVGAAMVGFWNSLGATSISLSGWIAMVLGVLASFAVGAGLMALAFFSDRRGYDRLDRD